MNADHRDAMNLYATRLLGAEQADWRCTGCDPDGIDMQAGAKTLRLDFPERVTGPGELRKMLVRLAGRGAGQGIADHRRGFERVRELPRLMHAARERRPRQRKSAS